MGNSDKYLFYEVGASKLLPISYPLAVINYPLYKSRLWDNYKKYF